MNALNQSENTPPLPQIEPAFVSVLMEDASDTLKACLKTLGAPAQLLELVDQMYILSMYRKMVAEDPSAVFPGIEEIAIETANLIVRSGGVFHTKSGVTLQARSEFLEEVTA